MHRDADPVESVTVLPLSLLLTTGRSESFGRSTPPLLFSFTPNDSAIGNRRWISDASFQRLDGRACGKVGQHPRRYNKAITGRFWAAQSVDPQEGKPKASDSIVQDVEISEINYRRASTLAAEIEARVASAHLACECATSRRTLSGATCALPLHNKRRHADNEDNFDLITRYGVSIRRRVRRIDRERKEREKSLVAVLSIVSVVSFESPVDCHTSRIGGISRSGGRRMPLDGVSISDHVCRLRNKPHN